MGEYAAANTSLPCWSPFFDADVACVLNSICQYEGNGAAIMTLQKRPDGAQGPDWIAVCVTHNLPEAHIILGKLRAYDIPALIHQEAGATAIGITLGNLGEIKILVSPADYERAAALLFPEDAEQIEAINDRIQLVWPDDDEPEIDDENE